MRTPNQDLIKLALVSLTIAFCLCRCGKQDAASVNIPDKSLFSSWAGVTNSVSGEVLDLTHGSFGTFSMTFLFVNGARCSFDCSVGGTTTSGNYILTNGAYISGGTDPGCATVTVSGTYALNASALRLCSAGNCYDYK